VNRRLWPTLFFTLVTFLCYGQNKIVVDGDELYLKDAPNEKVVFLDSIHRGSQNPGAIWITYDRRPGVDPWIRQMKDKSKRYSEETFVNFWKEQGITIFGAFTTYDDCQCAKTKATSSPDMYLIHFKISPDDWIKMRESYPDMGDYVKEGNH
jgi:hypothetical protein